MMQRPLIGVVNLSTKISNNDVAKLTTAIQAQLKNDVAPAWGRDYWFIIFYVDPQKLSPRAYPVLIVDDDATPGALGFHSEMNGRPYAKVMVNPILSNGGVMLYDPQNPQNVSVASVVSHEIIELFIDLYANIWVDGPKKLEGTCYAMESCDPVEANFYTNEAAGTPVSLSNFVLPAYFDEQSMDKKFDHLEVLNAPFSLANNGYMIVRNAPGTEQQVFGRERPPSWRLKMKQNKLGSRTSFRMPSNKKKKWWQYLF